MEGTPRTRWKHYASRSEPRKTKSRADISRPRLLIERVAGCRDLDRSPTRAPWPAEAEPLGEVADARGGSARRVDERRARLEKVRPQRLGGRFVEPGEGLVERRRPRMRAGPPRGHSRLRCRTRSSAAGRPTLRLPAPPKRRRPDRRVPWGSISVWPPGAIRWHATIGHDTRDSERMRVSGSRAARLAIAGVEGWVAEAWTALATGELDESLRAVEAGERLAQRCGIALQLPLFMELRADVAARRGDRASRGPRGKRRRDARGRGFVGGDGRAPAGRIHPPQARVKRAARASPIDDLRASRTVRPTGSARRRARSSP